MFSRDPQTLVITISRGTCIRGAIVILVSFTKSGTKFMGSSLTKRALTKSNNNRALVLRIVDHAVYDTCDKFVTFFQNIIHDI